MGPRREASSSPDTDTQTGLTNRRLHSQSGRWPKRHIQPEDERWHDVAASGGKEGSEDDQMAQNA